LERHRWIIMSDGYASVVAGASSDVHGLLWQLAIDDVPALDHYEEVSSGLYSKVVRPVRFGEATRYAFLYKGRRPSLGLPDPGYLAGIVDAASALRLPSEYVEGLRSWRATTPWM
jgi:hypothetical protein